MKKKTKFIQNFATIILAISIPGLLALASFETKRYATLEKEVSDLEKKQYELIEENKKLVSEIGMLSSSERIEKIAISESKLTVENFAKLLGLLKKGTISNNIAKALIVDILNTGKDAQVLVEEKGLSVISDESSILPIIQKIIADNQEQVAAYKGGKDKLFGFFVGQAMKETKGRANPQLLNKLLKEELDK